MVDTHEDEHTGHHQHQPKNRKFEFSRVETLCKYIWIRACPVRMPLKCRHDHLYVERMQQFIRFFKGQILE